MGKHLWAMIKPMISFDHLIIININEGRNG